MESVSAEAAPVETAPAEPTIEPAEAPDVPGLVPHLFAADGTPIPVTRVLESAHQVDGVNLMGEYQYEEPGITRAHLSCDRSLITVAEDGSGSNAAFTTSAETITHVIPGKPGPATAMGDSILVYGISADDPAAPGTQIMVVDEHGPRTILETTDTLLTYPYPLVVDGGGTIWAQGSMIDPDAQTVTAWPILTLQMDGGWSQQLANGELLGSTDDGILYALTSWSDDSFQPGDFQMRAFTAAGEESLISGTLRDETGPRVDPILAARSEGTLAVTLQHGQGGDPHLVVIEENEATVIVLGGPVLHLDGEDGWLAWAEGVPEEGLPAVQFLMDTQDGSVFRVGDATAVQGLPAVCGDRVAWDGGDEGVHVGRLP